MCYAQKKNKTKLQRIYRAYFVPIRLDCILITWFVAVLRLRSSKNTLDGNNFSYVSPNPTTNKTIVNKVLMWQYNNIRQHVTNLIWVAGSLLERGKVK